MKISDKKEIEIVVTPQMSAASMKSGGLNVFATPSMIAGMENVSFELLEESMEEGQTTVGVKIDISHLKGTAIGENVKFVAEITEISGRKITLKIQAYDKNGLIGEGIHQRFVVDIEKFMSKI